jgi:eukaryotic-like serine/threonine-protein kinase
MPSEEPALGERTAAANPAGDPTRGLSGASGQVVILEVVAGPHRGLCYEYDRHDTLLVGRGAAANLQLIDDPHFSRHHFLLEFNPPRVYLRDLNSSNGTTVNGKAATECLLNDGDEIAGGTTRIRITLKAPIAVEAGSAESEAHAVQQAERFAAETGEFSPNARDSVAALPNFIPGYEVIRELGAGGMGAVYLARERATGRERAIKLMLPESAASERATKLFLREASVLSRLDHPNIVRYHEMGFELGQFYFVMEYVPSTPLPEIVSRAAPRRRAALVCEIAARVLDALEYAHDCGIVHRDLKPANILMGSAGGKHVVKLSDFGLAKNFQNAGFSGMTMSRQMRGTFAFMAPEQLIRCRDARPPADLYALGATMYYLLAGRHPLTFGAGRDPVLVVLEDEPPPLARVCPGLPRGLEGVVHRALRKDPARRYADAPALRTALEPFLDDDD